MEAHGLRGRPPRVRQPARATRWRTTARGDAWCFSAVMATPATSPTRGSGTGAHGFRGRPPRARQPARATRWRTTASGDAWCSLGVTAPPAASPTRGSGTGARGREDARHEPASPLGPRDGVRQRARTRGAFRGLRDRRLSPTRGSGTGAHGSRGRPPRVRRPATATRWRTTARGDAWCFSGAMATPAVSPTRGSGMGARGLRGRPPRVRRPATTTRWRTTARGDASCSSGATAAPAHLADTWEWDGSTWVQRTPATSPPARVGPRDGVRQRAGTRGALRGLDVRAASPTRGSGTGTHGSRARRPRARQPATATRWRTTARGERVVLFGGDRGTASRPTRGSGTGATWVEQDARHKPTGAGDHAMAYDSARGRVVLFGGSAGISGISPTRGSGTGTPGRNNPRPEPAGPRLPRDRLRQRAGTIGSLRGLHRIDLLCRRHLGVPTAGDRW